MTLREMVLACFDPAAFVAKGIINNASYAQETPGWEIHTAPGRPAPADFRFPRGSALRGRENVANVFLAGLPGRVCCFVYGPQDVNDPGRYYGSLPAGRRKILASQ